MSEIELHEPHNYPVLAESGEAVELIELNFGSSEISEFDLDRIKVPAGGSTAWEVPTLDGYESEKTVEGIIVFQRNSRTYWASTFEDSGGGTAPDCTSRDGIIGEGLYGVGSEENPKGSCRTCPMSQWGSARDGYGQACSANIVLFVVREGELLPTMIIVPPSSIKPIRQYLLRLTSKNVPYYKAITKFELEKATSNSGITYSRIKPSLVEVLAAPEAELSAQYSKRIAAAFEGVPLTVDAA